MAAQLPAPFAPVSSQRALLRRTRTLGRGYLWLPLSAASGLPTPEGTLRFGVFRSPPAALESECEGRGLSAVEWSNSSRERGANRGKRLRRPLIMREAPVYRLSQPRCAVQPATGEG